MKTFGTKTKHILSSKRWVLINAKPFSLIMRCPSIANATSIKSYIRHLFNGAGWGQKGSELQAVCVLVFKDSVCILRRFNNKYLYMLVAI